jgi:hypothetical protein
MGNIDQDDWSESEEVTIGGGLSDPEGNVGLRF